MKPSELVVLTLIVVIGVSLLIIGVARVREQEKRQACRNNLTQIGVSVQHYHDVYRHYPAAVMANFSLPPQRRLSWLLNVIPYVVGSNIFARTARDKAWDASQNLFAASLRMPWLLCPALPGRQLVGPHFPTTYPGILGLGMYAALLPEEDKRAGLFGYERTTTAEGLKGRTSTLLIAAESSQVSGAWTAGGLPTSRGLDPEGPPYLGFGGQLGGLHRGGGANVLFADGSVRFLERNTDPKVFEAMAVIQGGGEPAP